MFKVDDGVIRKCIRCGKTGLHDVIWNDDYYEIIFSCWRCWKTYDVVDVINVNELKEV